MENKIQKYTLPAMVLHWLVAALIISLFIIGWYMVELPENVVPSVRKPWFELHKSLGITVFALLILRVIWRFTHTPPPLPPSVPSWQVRLVEVTHKIFYISMFLQPISGYLSSSFSGYKTKWFGFPLPHWGWKDEANNEFFSGVHDVSAMILLALIILHLAGVVSHLLKRDPSILKRMLP